MDKVVSCTALGHHMKACGSMEGQKVNHILETFDVIPRKGNQKEKLDIKGLSKIQIQFNKVT